VRAILQIVVIACTSLLVREQTISPGKQYQPSTVWDRL